MLLFGETQYVPPPSSNTLCLCESDNRYCAHAGLVSHKATLRPHGLWISILSSDFKQQYYFKPVIGKRTKPLKYVREHFDPI